MFVHDDGRGWKPSEQGRPMMEANERAKLKPPISFHGLRHTYASLCVMNNMPLMVIARNLGHANTRMVESHYGHMAPSFIADAIRASAPRFAVKTDKKITPLR
jgi:integrase